MGENKQEKGLEDIIEFMTKLDTPMTRMTRHNLIVDIMREQDDVSGLLKRYKSDSSADFLQSYKTMLDNYPNVEELGITADGFSEEYQLDVKLLIDKTKEMRNHLVDYFEMLDPLWADYVADGEIDSDKLLKFDGLGQIIQSKLKEYGRLRIYKIYRTSFNVGYLKSDTLDPSGSKRIGQSNSGKVHMVDPSKLPELKKAWGSYGMG